MLRVQNECVATLWPDIKNLYAAHMLEVYGEIDDIDIERHYKLEEMDILRCYSLREYGELLGYAVFHVVTGLHGGGLAAHNIALYVIPGHRGFASLMFIRELESLLRSDDIEVVYISVGQAKDFGKVLERNKYFICEKVYKKGL